MSSFVARTTMCSRPDKPSGDGRRDRIRRDLFGRDRASFFTGSSILADGGYTVKSTESRCLPILCWNRLPEYVFSSIYG